MRIISPGSLKGGTGKSATIFSLAGISERRGKKVLIIDNDPQGNSTNNCGVPEEVAAEMGTQNIFESGTSAESLIIKSPLETHPNLDIIPGSLLLHRADMNLVSEPARETVLKRWMKKNKEILNQYDLIFIDVNPTMSLINQNSFLVSDSIILISEVGLNSALGVKYFVQLWGGISYALDVPNKIKALIVNKYRSNVNMHKDFIPYLSSQSYELDDGNVIDLGEIIIDSPIPLNSAIGETEAYRIPINTYKPESKGAKAYVEIADSLAKRGVL